MMRTRIMIRTPLCYHSNRFVNTGILLLFCSIFATTAVSDDHYAQLRREARERPRSLVFNNDGCDVLYFPRHLEVTRENFLRLRTSWLANNGVPTALMYCPISAGQGNFTIPLEDADFLTADPPNAFCRNIAGELQEHGHDFFAWILEYCRQNNIELFFSFRFNDYHDHKHRPDKPSFLFCKWKNENRHLLFGRDHTQSPRNGWWSSVDYSHPEVRQRQLALVKAVLEKYDVDGIDLDFSRYLPIFRNAAEGEPATTRQLDDMTALMQEIRAALDQKGRERGRGLLLSVVLPDSMKLCRKLGYDVERWFQEGLVDIVQQCDGFRIGAVAEIAALAHRYDVKYYAFNGSPWPYAAKENGSLLFRRCRAAYAARAHTALCGGADGVYLYNITNAGEMRIASRWSKKTLENELRRYFATDYAWEIPRGYAFSPEDYQDCRQLTAWCTCTIAPGTQRQYFIELGEKPRNNDRIIAYIDRLTGPSGNLTLSSNGVKWHSEADLDRYESYVVPVEALRTGRNTITIEAGEWEGDACLVWEAEKLSDFELTFFGAGGQDAFTEEDDGSYIVTRTSKLNGLVKRFGMEEFTRISFVFQGRAEGDGAWARFANGGYAQVLELLPGKVRLPGTSFQMPLDTSIYHTFNVTMEEERLTFEIDGRKVWQQNNTASGYTAAANAGLDTAGRLYGSTTSLMLGTQAGSSSFTRSQWRSVRVESAPGSVKLANLMLEIDPMIAQPPVPDECAAISLPMSGAGSALDGRVTILPSSADKCVYGAEIRMLPGNRRNIWVVSNGMKVAAWYITSDGFKSLLNSPSRIDLNPENKPVTYRIVFEGSEHAVYRDGLLFYRTTADGSHIYQKGEIFTVSETLTPSEFLKRPDLARLCTEAEKAVISNGGTFARGLTDNAKATCGTLLEMKLWEKSK
jgi:hypothetical protein